MSYLGDIWSSRHFWVHLSRSELRARFRKSRLGILWALLQPLLMTLLIAFVMGSVFGQSIKEFAPFVFSGILVWDFISVSVIAGSGSFIAAEAYIKQRKLPIIIYPLKLTITNSIMFSIGFLGLLGWAIIDGEHSLGAHTLSLLLVFPMLFIIGWPLAIISGFINAKFRDFQLFIGLVLQALYFVSPVFIKPDYFTNARIGYLVDYNPIAHLLAILRAPLLSNALPGLYDYLYVLGFALVLWCCAAWKVWREERDVIFYL
jgi:lipopolysaccharide transport system permease protein